MFPSLHQLCKNAATETVNAEENKSHGGDNGALTRLVLKTYWEDHPDGPQMFRRGRKQDEVVVVQQLTVILVAAEYCGLAWDEMVPLKEYRHDGTELRGEATVREIVLANLDWLVQQLRRWQHGDHSKWQYYVLEEVRWALIGDLFRQVLGPQVSMHTQNLLQPLRALLRELLCERRSQTLTSESPLRVASWILAWSGLGETMVPTCDAMVRRLCQLQVATLAATTTNPVAHWDADCIYRLRTHPLHFGSAGLTTAFAAAALGRYLKSN